MHRLAQSITASLLALGSLIPLAAGAATHTITAGTNGASCGSGGYFTPPSISATSGESVTLTFSVPANDPYAGGMEVRGFPGGTFQIARGGSASTTFTAGSNISFSGYWPSSGCHKGDGTVTVAAAATPAPAASATPPAASASSSPSASPSASPSPTPTPAAAPTRVLGLSAGAASGLLVALVALVIAIVLIIRHRRTPGGPKDTTPPSSDPPVPPVS